MEEIAVNAALENGEKRSLTGINKRLSSTRTQTRVIPGWFRPV